MFSYPVWFGTMADGVTVDDRVVVNKRWGREVIRGVETSSFPPASTRSF